MLGAGSWGTALAVHLGRVGHDVRLWARDRALVDEHGARRANAVYLPDVRCPTRLGDHALDDALPAPSSSSSAIPSHGCRAVMRGGRAAYRAARHDRQRDERARGGSAPAHVGGDRAGARRRSHPVVVLSGPSFAREVAQQLPTAVLAASPDAAATELVQAEFRGPYFRLYGSDDVIGVEIGGAMKNVIAIAAGVVEGLGLGPQRAGRARSRAGWPRSRGSRARPAAGARRWPA